jgi:DNA polymerase III subunit epsilon
MRQIVLDTETTGLSADNGDRIVEIGCVELLNRKLTGNNKHFYLNAGRDSHEEALKVHGLTTEFLKDKPQFALIVDEFLAYIEGAEIIIHNAAFDVGFLNKELELVGRPHFNEFIAGVTDTFLMSKEMFPGKHHSLNALCGRLGVDYSGRILHGALLDAELLADAYINLTRGQEALLMDVGTTETIGPSIPLVSLKTISLPILMANSQELFDHDDVLNQIDKSSRSKTVWRL